MKLIKKLFKGRDLILSLLGIIYIFISIAWILMAIALIGLAILFSARYIFFIGLIVIAILYIVPISFYSLIGTVCWRLSKKKVYWLWKLSLEFIAISGIVVPIALYFLQRIHDNSLPIF